MKAIILAAGMGTRLEHLTNDKPKCLVELWGTTLLERQLEQLKNAGIEDILVIGGYQTEKIAPIWPNLVVNPDFNSSNMVFSLTFALDWLTLEEDADVLILYGDIAYSQKNLNTLIKHQSTLPLTVLGNRHWLELWQQRMDNPLEDAETFKFDSNNRLLEIGQPPKEFEDVMGQFMGMYKTKSMFLTKKLNSYLSLVQQCHDYKNLYMTDFLQSIIDEQHADTTLVNGEWIELDTIEDFELYNRYNPEHFGID
jgi:choline kinase